MAYFKSLVAAVSVVGLAIGSPFIIEYFGHSKSKIENPQKIVMEEHYKGMNVKYRGTGFKITVIKDTGFELEGDTKVWKVSGTLRFEGDNETCVWYEGLTNWVSNKNCKNIEELILRIYEYSTQDQIKIPIQDLNKKQGIKIQERFDGLKESLDFERIYSNWQIIFR